MKHQKKAVVVGPVGTGRKWSAAMTNHSLSRSNIDLLLSDPKQIDLQQDAMSVPNIGAKLYVSNNDDELDPEQSKVS